MPRRLRSCVLALLFLGACAAPYIPPPPPGPPAPPPGPVVPPAPPTPVDPSDGASKKIVPYATVALVVKDAKRSDILKAVVYKPSTSSVQDDGTLIEEWPTLNANGEKRWLDISFTVADATGERLVIGHALIPRAK